MSVIVKAMFSGGLGEEGEGKGAGCRVRVFVSV